LDETGTAQLNLEDVSRGLGFTRTAASGNLLVRWETIRRYLEDLNVPASWHDENPPIGNEGLPEFIPENIFYKLCFKAKNEIALAFQSLITDEILPTIRKTGGYVANEDLFIATYLSTADDNTKTLFRVTLTTIRQQTEMIKQRDEVIESQKPLVDFATTVTNSADTIDVGQLAKLARDEKINIGRNRLFKWLRNEKILRDNNEPYQSALESGWFKVNEYTYNTPYGPKLGVQTLVTGKGQVAIIEKLRKAFVAV
jgi:anti-repressor protein